jgi:peptidoglycan-associated lipoprotein
MVFRNRRTLALLLAVALTTTACSHKPKEGDEGNLQVQQQNPAGATGVDQSNGSSTTTTNGATPGSQQDLVVNVGDRVFFAYDSHDVSPEGQTTLQKQAAWLKQYPNVNVMISGNCDERGTREYNLALGERRAASAKNYLVSLGVSPDRINTISYGKERPAVVGSTPEVWAQNRRAVTEVQ